MRNSTEIPDGYKDSPLGIIPEDWEVRRLGECFDISAGRDLEKPFFSEIRTELFVYPVYSNSLDNKGLYGFTSKPRCKANSITITGRGYLGHAEYRFSDFDAIVRLLVLHPKIEIVCGLIADYINFKKPFVYESTGVPQLTVPQVKRSCLLIPPYEEQIRLYQVLKLWDAAIEKQEELIDKLTLRKRGLMQQLLTGKKRLPGFSGKWEQVKLGDIAERVTQKNDENNQNVVTISAQHGFISQTEFFNKSIASDTLDGYFLVNRDEFCYNKSYSNGYPMGVIKRLKSFDKAVVTTLYICFRLRNHNMADIDFFEQYCESGILNRELVKIANEGGRAHGLLNVTPTDFFNMHMMLPEIDEQRAIAQVLVNADNEIEQTKAKLASLQSQKRGLMQQLLIGKKRI